MEPGVDTHDDCHDGQDAADVCGDSACGLSCGCACKGDVDRERLQYANV